MIKRNKIQGELVYSKRIDMDREKVPFQTTPRNASRGQSLTNAGLVYERQLVKYLQALYEERVQKDFWFEFADDKGKGFCQPDFLIYPTSSEPLIVGECKRTATKKAYTKLRNIYIPVVSLWAERNDIELSNGVKGVQVCKYRSRQFDDEICTDLTDMFTRDSNFVTVCISQIPKV